MAASRILLVESDPDARETIEGPLTAAGYSVSIATGGDDAIAGASDNQLIVIGHVAGERGAIDVCREIRRTPALASIPVMCVADSDDVEARISFLEAGADDVVARPFDARELEARVEALLLRFQRSRDLAPALAAAGVIATPPRRTVVVFSAKGGVGATTIAVNVAMAKAVTEPDKVVIVDLDLQFGQVTTFLDLTPRQTIADLVRDEQALREPELLRTYATRHDSGLHVLAAPGSPELARLVTARHVDALLETILGTYDFVVVDAGSTLDERTLAAFEAGQSLIFPVYPDIAALKSLHSLVEYLNESGSIAAKATFVLNNLFAKEILRLRDVESSLGTKVALELPYDPFIYLKAVNEGNPIVTGAPRSPAAERLGRLSSLAFGNELLVAAAAFEAAEPSTNGRKPRRFALRRR
ncbi:MAG TPA: AAA family ATPase [Candidatus Limnocylindrales bacterium]|nr:AAA family ATPase [Candidatus Limnocylindrales bacterium]